MTRCTTLIPDPAMFILSLTSVTWFTGPLCTPIRSWICGCSCNVLLISSAHRTGSSGLWKNRSVIPSPVGTRTSLPFVSAARKHSDNLIQLLEQLNLLIDQQLRVTDH